MKLRREVHKLFDKINCSKFETILYNSSSRAKRKIVPALDLTNDSNTDFSSYDNLIYRDCYLTFTQLADLDLLELELHELKATLLHHLLSSNCLQCDTVYKCQFCIHQDRHK